MKNIIATFRAKPGQRAALQEKLQDLVNSTAGEPGAMVYDLMSDDAQPDTIVVFEQYRDADAKATHLAAPYLKQALERTAPLVAEAPALQHLTTAAFIRHGQVEVDGREVELVVLPLGPVALVYARTERGLLACGAVDPAALEKFGIPAARVRPTRGTSIANLDDLLTGEVREANAKAQALGVVPGMLGREALRRL